MHLIFDTETTGFPLKGDIAIDHPTQPYLVQIAMLLLDETFEEVACASFVIRQPEDFDIPTRASDIHGITTDYAQYWGVPVMLALSTFHNFAQKAKFLVAHNIDFDMAIMRIAFARATKTFAFAQELFCTMKSMTDVCKIKAPWGNKWPKLTEAHEFAFGGSFDDAHDAFADVKATARVYKWILQNKVKAV